tara:strand:- start:1158 stop:1454 length:297 start_codon:yes stop_codon:yes gene_type:complete
MEFNWHINNLTRNTSDGLVYDIEYVYETIVSGSIAQKYGNIEVSGSSTEDSFVSFENLTQDIVLGWITGSFDIPAIQLELSSSLSKLITTQSIAGTPW